MKLFSWNINGIRSVFKTTFQEWLKANDPDIVCLQETKADVGELGAEFTQIPGYWAYFNSSQVKKGHAGVAVYTKIKPLTVETKLGIERFDDEGRCLKLTFKDFTLFNFYIPNGARDQHDIPYKLEVYKKLLALLAPLSSQNIILAGDFNIAHQEIDVFNAKQNLRNTMFTAPEREQISALLKLGYVDCFRDKYPEKKSYTWWPYMGDLRDRDIGWRIDYFFVTKSLQPLITDVCSYREIAGSDHGPLGLVLDKTPEVTERATYPKREKQLEMF